MQMILIILFFMFTFQISGLAETKLKTPQQTKLENFTLIDQNGRTFELYQKSNKRLVLLYVYGIGCPIARKSLNRLNEISKKFSSLIDVALIDSSPQDNRHLLLKETKTYQIAFPILIDDTQEVARSLSLERTGEVILIESKNWNVIYRGPINNAFTYTSDIAENKIGIVGFILG